MGHAARVHVGHPSNALRDDIVGHLGRQAVVGQPVFDRHDTRAQCLADQTGVGSVGADDGEFVKERHHEWMLPCPKVLQDRDFGGVRRGVGAQQFKCHETVGVVVLGEPDGGKAAGAELLKDAVTPVVDRVADRDRTVPARLVLLDELEMVADPLVRALGRFFIIRAIGGRQGEGTKEMKSGKRTKWEKRAKSEKRVKSEKRHAQLKHGGGGGGGPRRRSEWGKEWAKSEGAITRLPRSMKVTC